MPKYSLGSIRSKIANDLRTFTDRVREALDDIALKQDIVESNETVPSVCVGSIHITSSAAATDYTIGKVLPNEDDRRVRVLIVCGATADTFTVTHAGNTYVYALVARESRTFTVVGLKGIKEPYLIQAATAAIDFSAYVFVPQSGGTGKTGPGGVGTAEFNDLSASVTWVNVPDAFITQSSVIQHVAAIDHDALLNFLANEHIDWTVTGAEDIHADRFANAPVLSVFGRSGDVVAIQADYDSFFLTPAEGDAAYLAIGAKAADSELLDGVDGTDYARVNTAEETFQGNVVLNAANPIFRWYDTGGPVDEKRWDIFASAGILRLRAWNDAGTLNDDIFTVNRTAEIIDNLHLHTDLVIDGVVDGRDIATDGTKLDTIETNAKDDQTAAEIEAIVNHDNLLGFDVNEHFLQSAISITLSQVSDSGALAALNTVGASQIDNNAVTLIKIDNNAVSLAKMADIATARFLGRVTAATGDPEVLTGTQATTLIDIFTSALKGLVPASGGSASEFLSADGTFKATGGGGALIDLSDVNTSTPTNRFVLVADGVDFESRLLIMADVSDAGNLATLDTVDTAQIAAAAVGRSEIANSVTTSAGFVSGGSRVNISLNNWALFPMCHGNVASIVMGTHATDGGSASSPRMSVYNISGGSESWDVDHRWIIAA